MISVVFSVKPKRITEEIIRKSFGRYTNADELEQYIERDLLFLRDIQDNILDRYFNENKFIVSYLNDHDITKIEEANDEYSLTTVISQYRNHCSYPLHVRRIAETAEEGVLYENIEPLYECYNIEREINNLPKGTA